ncbi:hypothetical protein [Agrobacterium larrymoorei]|uniref:GNAT family N-acetyltransferase n=1 Tax=Agrobacterium larrymoorei TaxID=160699 RepID=A0ABU0ULU8_9HYPH|nr:hypothetical protein [Agrobacterium larrymoorei]MDQ1185942.1 hypothetical protein [Agrobacterium larrymoorei]
MSYRLDSPATLFDVAELCGATTRIHWAVAREMWRTGETFAMRDDDKLLGVFGLYPIEEGAEAWFDIRPEGAPFMLRLIRDIRLTLASRSYPEIVVICHTEAGRRIAAASGFQLFSEGDLTYGRYVRRGQQGEQTSAGTAEAGSGGAAAPDACGSRASTG